MLDKPHIEGQ